MRTSAVCLISLSIVSGGFFAQGAAGSLDATFGSGGKVETVLGKSVIPSRVLLQPTGNIVVIAGIDNAAFATEAFLLLRYLPDGRIDSSFGQQGISLAAFTSFANFPNAAALQPDGKIVVAGEASNADGTLSEFAVARFNANGGLDSTFGSGGRVTTNFVGVQPGGVKNPATAVLIQTDGKILVGGSARQCAKCGTSTALARYNANGSLDGTFGTGGMKTAMLFDGPPNAMAELANGDLLAIAGSAITQFKPDGSLEPVVTGGAIVAESVGGVNAFQPDGRYLLAQGARGAPGESDRNIQLLRFQATGGADFTFQNAPFDFGGDAALADSGSAVVVQPDRRILVGGSSRPDITHGNLGLARMNGDGSMDWTFGRAGRVTTTFGDGQAGVIAMAVQPDSKIVVIGQNIANGGSVTNLVLARYLGD